MFCLQAIFNLVDFATSHFDIWTFGKIKNFPTNGIAFLNVFSLSKSSLLPNPIQLFNCSFSTVSRLPPTDHLNNLFGITSRDLEPNKQPASLSLLLLRMQARRRTIMPITSSKHIWIYISPVCVYKHAHKHTSYWLDEINLVFVIALAHTHFKTRRKDR